MNRARDGTSSSRSSGYGSKRPDRSLSAHRSLCVTRGNLSAKGFRIVGRGLRNPAPGRHLDCAGDAQSKAPAAAAIGSVRLTNRQGQLSGVVQGREGADTGRASRINVSQADGVVAIRIDIAAGSVYLRSCPSGTQSTSAPRLDFSEIGIIPPGLKRMLGASHAIRSGGQPCSPRARRSRRGRARS